MKSKQCTYLLDTEEDCLQTSSSGTRQLSLLSETDMPAKFSENEQQTDGSQDCKCGKGTFNCLIHPSTPEKWIAYMQDSLAKTLALLESRQAYLREPDLVFTEKSCGLLAWYDQENCSWKTYQQSLVTGWEPYLETWPRWGMTQDGVAFAHPMSERIIRETDGFYLPTPRANAAMAATITPASAWDSKRFPNLETIVGRQMWPTPTAHNAKETNAPSEAKRNTPTLASQVGGKLNPLWIEWMMGFPIGFTVLKDWVTRKSRSKRQQHTDSLGAK
jgi:hypothetical protein